MRRDPVAVLRSMAKQNARGCYARGDREQERKWLDVLHLLDQAETEEASHE